MEDAWLLYNIRENNAIVEKQIPVYAEKTDIYGKEFYMSFQAGIEVTIAFTVNRFDFEESYHTDQSTKKEKYASQILYNGAKYDIIRCQSIKNDEMLLLCR